VITVFLFLMQMSHPDHAMGFSQEATKHTFRLFTDGGAIEVRAIDPGDSASLGMVRHHLHMIAASFADGDFSKPDVVHGRLPDGAATMKELRRNIEYRYSDIPSGGRIRITTKNARALKATHRFLRFQIREHKTGDPIAVTSE
jgi:hypothetical protein